MWIFRPIFSWNKLKNVNVNIYLKKLRTRRTKYSISLPWFLIHPQFSLSVTVLPKCFDLVTLRSMNVLTLWHFKKQTVTNLLTILSCRGKDPSKKPVLGCQGRLARCRRYAPKWPPGRSIVSGNNNRGSKCHYVGMLGQTVIRTKWERTKYQGILCL